MHRQKQQKIKSICVFWSGKCKNRGLSPVVRNLEGTGLQPQMTVEWVKQVAANLQLTPDPAKMAVATRIFAAIEARTLQLATSAVNKKTGQLVVVPLKR